jgi:hypothetical protein
MPRWHRLLCGTNTPFDDLHVPSWEEVTDAWLKWQCEENGRLVNEMFAEGVVGRHG